MTKGSVVSSKPAKATKPAKASKTVKPPKAPKASKPRVSKLACPKPRKFTSPMADAMLSPVRQFEEDLIKFNQGQTSHLLAKGIRPHEFQSYFMQGPQQVNMFCPSSLMAHATPQGNIRLQSGAVLNVFTNQIQSGSFTSAPVHMIDVCRGGKVAGVVPIDSMWWTVGVDGHRIAPCGSVYDYARLQ